jgi:hypothetical protein
VTPMLRIPLLLAAVAAAALGLAGCPDDPAEPPPDAAPGEPLTVEEALQTDPDQAVTVRGFLFIEEGELPELCDLVLETYPPQCGGAAVDVEGLDPGAYTLDSDEETGLRERERHRGLQFWEEKRQAIKKRATRHLRGESDREDQPPASRHRRRCRDHIGLP